MHKLFCIFSWEIVTAFIFHQTIPWFSEKEEENVVTGVSESGGPGHDGYELHICSEREQNAQAVECPGPGCKNARFGPFKVSDYRLERLQLRQSRVFNSSVPFSG